VYVASIGGQALVMFDRDAASRNLAYRGCITTISGCGAGNDGLPGLHGALGVAVSSDNRTVVVTAWTSDALTLFDREPGTRTVTYRGCFTGGSGCTIGGNGLPGLDGASDVAVSRDGRTVYVASELSDALVRFDRDPGSRAIAHRACWTQLSAGCGLTGVAGLDGARGVAVSDDGRGVFVAADAADALALFDRVPDDPPACAPAARVATPTGVAARIALNCRDSNDDPFTVSLTGAPAHGTVSVAADNASALYTPDAGFVGEDRFKLRPAPGSGPAGPESEIVVTVGTPGGGPAGATPVLGSRLRHAWAYTRRWTRVRRLTVTSVPGGSTVAISCRGRGCPPRKRLRSVAVGRDTAAVPLARRFGKRKLRPRAVVQVRVTKPGFIGKAFRYTVRKSKEPASRPRCIPAGGGALISCPS
jgi:DNA-binding beta-propeller fold protein YncE